jgi:uncharacterized repeat protein (TIGR03803 family)
MTVIGPCPAELAPSHELSSVMACTFKRGPSMKSVFRSSLPAFLFAVAFLFAAAATRAQTYSVLYSFKGEPDGGNPFGGLVRDAAGNLYGTTPFGGPRNPHCPGGCGTVFKVNSAGSESILYAFNDTTSGASPEAGLILDSQGNLYGFTLAGGGNDSGTIFEISAAGAYTVLYNFKAGANGEGFAAPTPLVRDSAGNLYGVLGGGRTSTSCDCGTLFKLTPAGAESVVYSFTGGAAGYEPETLVLDSTGTFYGATELGGNLNCEYPAGCGVLYSVDAGGSETVLYSFPQFKDGFQPASLIRDSAGNFYGTTYWGGDPTCGSPGLGCGALFRVDTAGNETILHTFLGEPADGYRPYAGVIRDSAGNFYGTTYEGGAYNAGTVYKLDTAGNFTLLYNFTDGSDGGYPQAGLVMDSAGNLYGTATFGAGGRCTYGCGVVFKITP